MDAHGRACQTCRQPVRGSERCRPAPADKRGLGKGEHRNKVVSLAEAVALVRSGDTICTSGFVGIGTPDDLLVGLERRFVETGEPRNLTLLFAAGQGDGKEQGLNRLGP